VKKLWKLPRREIFSAASGGQDARISLPDLERALASVEPAARLVLPRLLRRVVRLHTSLPGIGFRVPHSRTYVLPQKDLLEFADRGEIGFGPGEDLPDEVILLERPNSEILDERPRGAILLYYWELLFHARVHKEFHDLAAKGRFGPSEAQNRLAALGSLECDEIRNVLQQEHFLLPPYDEPSLYVEFAAVYLDIRYFQPGLIASFFPALLSLEKVDAVIAQDIQADSILDATRLPGTPDPEELREAARIAAEQFDADPQAAILEPAEKPRRRRTNRWGRSRTRCEAKYLSWSERARRQAARGNLAGAAIRLAQAEFCVPRERAAEAENALREAVHGLVARLQTALDIENAEPRPWREALLALAHQTPRGIWTVEARLLYDLQKVCDDQARTTSTIDVMHWIFSLGRRPIRRELPNQRLVLITRRLRSAQRRLPSARISDRQRRQLAEVLDAATKSAETSLRETFRPKIVATLGEVGLVPQNLVEVVSREKMVEELLDLIVERGFLTMGEVRDAVSRNHVKLPDCAGPADFFRGDAVLRLDGRLAIALDGVYETGDFYQRWIERFSFAAFGTFLGRQLTKYLAIPFGGAFVILVVVEHLVELVTREKEYYTPTWKDWRSYGPTLLVGILLFGLIHVPRFRAAVWELLKLAGQTLKLVFYDSFRRFFGLPLVQRFLGSPPVLFIFRYAGKPAAPTLLVWLLLPSGMAVGSSMIAVGSMFLLLNLLINSRLGRNFEEMVIDWCVENIHRFGVQFLLGLFWWLVDLFRRIMNWIERLMYAVDELLRFKSGQSRAIMILKGALGAIWFFIAYFIRFCVNLLVEPQLNPVKHVPWVTVSHKVLAGVWISIDLPALVARYMNPTLAKITSAAIVFLIPGIFGYLIWELKENWRLFAANRSKTLDPVLIGSHGETLSRLLRPGIHSGTIPKRFAKLRRAERKALAAGRDPAAVRRHREALHHIEIFMIRYIEREFIAWFSESRGWPLPPPQVEEIHLATNSITVHFSLPGIAGGPLTMLFHLVDGRLDLELCGQIPSQGISVPMGTIFRSTVINVLKSGGVDRLELTCGGPGAAAEPQEIAELDMPWSEWVAIWESGGKVPESDAWDRVRVI
jgi:hypothetical protein